jgi:tetratricopeptide (TPR) repeat protein
VAILHGGIVQQIEKLPRIIAQQLLPLTPTSDIAFLRATLRRDATPVSTSQPELHTGIIVELNRALPLNPMPFLWEANRAIEQGQSERAFKLLQYAQESDPRNINVRQKLIALYFARGHKSAAVQNLYSAAELAGSRGHQGMIALFDGVDKYSIQSDVLELVKANPERSIPFYEKVKREKIGHPLSLALIEQTPPSGSAARRILPWLVLEGHAKQALTVWRKQNDLGPTDEIAWPQNHNFDQPMKVAPFAWTDRTKGASRASFQNDAASSGTRIAKFTIANDETATLLLQTVAIKPGEKFQMTAPYRLRHGHSSLFFSWSLSCQDGKELASQSITSASERSGDLKLKFTVPKRGCDFQVIRFAGKSQRTGRHSEIDILPIQSAAPSQALR